MSRFALSAGVLGFTGVALGAFGAHAMKAPLAEHATTALWQTAVSYQLVHAVSLLALAAWERPAPPTRLIRAAGWCWTIGVVLFSGSLYALALQGPPRLLGPVTPLGGAALLAGWALVIAQSCRKPAAPAP